MSSLSTQGQADLEQTLLDLFNEAVTNNANQLNGWSETYYHSKDPIRTTVIKHLAKLRAKLRNRNPAMREAFLNAKP
jgi:ribonuclease D